MKLEDVLLLDRVQKGLRIAKDAARHLRAEGLIEGRYPHLHVSAKVAALTGRRNEYMRKKARPSTHYHDMILEYIGKWPKSSRTDINEYLMDEIRGDFSIEDKISKITNGLSYLRRNGKIKNVGTDTKPQWIIADPNEIPMRFQ